MNVLTLDQFSETLRRALETQPRIIQANDRKNFAPDLEAEIVAPLQVLSGLRERQTVVANGIDAHANWLKAEG
jgi:hypothetical protein